MTPACSTGFDALWAGGCINVSKPQMIHESVGQNEQMLTVAELESLFSNRSEGRVQFRSISFALFRHRVSPSQCPCPSS